MQKSCLSVIYGPETTHEELRSVLEKTGIDYSWWPRASQKSTDNLLVELNAGESILIEEAGHLCRMTSVVTMFIEDSAKGLLLEDYQILKSGERRDIGRPPGGKMLTGELPIDRVHKEMLQELKLTKVDYDCVAFDDLPVTEETIESPSYPSLPSVYQVYRFQLRLKPWVIIEDGYSVIDTDGKKLFFRWSHHNLETPI